MDASWIESYGYWAVLLAAMLEGETAFILTGYALSRGYLHPAPTFLLAVVGASLSDTLYYWLGRTRGPALIRAFPVLRKLRARSILLLRRWGRATAFLLRFAYGLRIVLPLTMGAARFRYPVFLPFNVLGSLSFATLYLGLGFLFGETMEKLLGSVRGKEGWIVLGLVAVGALVWAAREWGLFHPKEELPEVEEPDEAP